MRRPPDPHLRHVLYDSLIMGPHHLPTVARRSGLGYDLLLKICHGERHLLAKHLPALYRGTQDLDLFAEVSGARDCDLLVTERGAGEHVPGSPSGLTLRISAAVGELSELVAEAEKDGSLSTEECQQIALAAEVIERKVQALRRVVVMENAKP